EVAGIAGFAIERGDGALEFDDEVGALARESREEGLEFGGLGLFGGVAVAGFAVFADGDEFVEVVGDFFADFLGQAGGEHGDGWVWGWRASVRDFPGL